MDTKSVVRDFLEGAWHYEKRMSLCNVLSPDYVMHAPTGDIAGCGAFVQAIAADAAAAPDLVTKVDTTNRLLAALAEQMIGQRRLMASLLEIVAAEQLQTIPVNFSGPTAQPTFQPAGNGRLGE